MDYEMKYISNWNVITKSGVLNLRIGTLVCKCLFHKLIYSEAKILLLKVVIEILFSNRSRIKNLKSCPQENSAF